VEKQLIVGIDPGTSVGLAFLDIDGNVLGVKSSRNLAIEDIITEIAAVGKAAVVATDKAIAPPVLTKVSGILGTRLFTPDYDLPVERKREMAERWPTNNDHERDSLAAAVYAYNHFQNKIRRIERQVLDELERTKARVLKGEKVSDILAPPEGSGREKELLAQMGSLRKENRELREELESVKTSQPKSPHAVIREAAKEAKKIMMKLAEGELLALKEAPSLAYADLKSMPIRQGEVILCRSKTWDNNGLRFLESRRAGAIITPAAIESLVPHADLADVRTVAWEGLFFADPYDIEQKAGRRKEVKARDVEDMLVDYRKGRR
jgi:hypothetical protein